MDNYIGRVVTSEDAHLDIFYFPIFRFDIYLKILIKDSNKELKILVDGKINK